MLKISVSSCLFFGKIFISATNKSNNSGTTRPYRMVSIRRKSCTSSRHLWFWHSSLLQKVRGGHLDREREWKVCSNLLCLKKIKDPLQIKGHSVPKSKHSQDSTTTSLSFPSKHASYSLTKIVSQQPLLLVDAGLRKNCLTCKFSTQSCPI